MKNGAMAVLCATAALAAVPASAQNSGAPAPSDPVGTAASSDGKTTIEDIVVTARRRKEAMQTVPVAITAFSGSQLAQLGVAKVSDLRLVAAGLNVQGAGGGREDSPLYLLRGQHSSSSALTQDGPVASYVDDIVIGQAQGSNSSLFDLESIQVLKGPQGTLFGRNTTGGAILFATAKPKDQFEAGIKGGVGNYDQRLVEAFINIPVSEKLKVRAAMQYNHHSGFTAIVAGPLAGQRLQDRDELNGRAIVEYDPTATIKSTAVAYGGRSESSGPGFILLGISPVGTARFVPGIAGYLAAQNARDIHESASGSAGRGSQVHQWGIYDTTAISLSDAITFKNIIGYRHVNSSDGFDYDGTPAILLDNDTVETSRQFTEEAQFLGQAFQDRLSYVLGIYYFNMHGLEEVDYSASLVPLNRGSPTFSGGAYRNTSISGYGQLTWRTPIEKLSFTAGLRYTSDQREITVSPHSLPSAPIGEVCNLSQPGVTYTLANCSRHASATFARPTWTFSLDYKLDHDTLVYLAHRRGYRAGGFNSRAATDAQFKPFSPETVDDIELGIKKDWTLGGWRVRTNLAGYNQWYQNVQRTVTFFNNGALVNSIINAASAKIYGGEAEITIEPTKNLRFGVNYAYVHPKYSSFTVVDTLGGVPGQMVNEADRKFSFVPTHQLNANVHYELPIAGKSTVGFTANYAYQSNEVFSDQYQNVAQLQLMYAPAVAAKIPANLPGFGQKGYGLVNLRLDWNDIADKPITASVLVQNLTNKQYLASGLTTYESLGAALGVPGDPRTIMGQVSVKF